MADAALGVLLAAGAGSRMGRPKALVHDADGTSWLRRGVEVLHEGGCAEVLVVLGAQADEAAGLVPAGAEITVAEDWESGMAASLAHGLRSAADTTASCAVVLLVDLPDVTSDVVARMLGATGGAGGSAATDSLARATYAGQPGHPVVLGRAHWSGVLATLEGDEGAAGYLLEHDAVGVECGDLASGRDQDTPQR